MNPELSGLNGEIVDLKGKWSEKHFKNKNNLLLLKIAIDRLDQEALRWEVSRNNEKFPHLYGDLNLNAVISVEELPDNR